MSLSWTQVGLDINGESALDESGYSVSLSADGNRAAIGAVKNDGTNGANSGHVRVYDLIGNTWTQVGQDIDGEAIFDWSGYSVSLNANGNRVAIGAIFNNGNGSDSGHVRVYDWNGSSWTKVGLDIDGEAADDNNGYSVSLSADGSRLAIGAPGNNIAAGHVRVYDLIGTSWIKVGENINGKDYGDNSGRSVSLSSDGNRVAIGSIGNDDSGASAGQVRVYDWNGTSWIKVGQNINGEAKQDQSGWSVSLSSNGNRVAIGAPTNDGGTDINNDIINDDRGHVRVYDLIGNTWTKVGLDINGEAAGNQSGRSVSLSSDGNRVAIGAIYNNENGSNAGHVRVYDFSGNAWTKVGEDIDGDANDYSGWSVSLTSDGSRVAIGATGSNNLKGRVRVYDFKIKTTLTNFTIPNKTFGDVSFALVNPISNSDGDFSYITSNTRVATISGNTLTILGFGTTTITAIQATTINYTTASISATLTVAKTEPTILYNNGFNAIQLRIAGYTASELNGAGYQVSDVTTAGYSASELKTASYTATQLKVASYSLIQLVVADYNDSELLQAGYSQNEINIARIPIITNFNDIYKLVGDSNFSLTPPTSNSNGSFSYTSSNSAVATISGNTVTIVGFGIAIITSTQSASTPYISGSSTAFLYVNRSETFVSSGLNYPTGLAFDSSGNLYCANYNGNSITKITSSGSVTTFVNTGLNGPIGLAFNSSGILYCSNLNNNSIIKITPDKNVSTFVSAGLNLPLGLAFDSSGILYCANNGNNTISRITPNGIVSTFVSNTKGLNQPYYIKHDSVENLYCVNYATNTISKITPNGDVTTFLNSGLKGPVDLTFDSFGNLYYTNNANSNISRVTPSGVITSIADSGLNKPYGLTIDSSGNLYCTNTGNNTISKITMLKKLTNVLSNFTIPSKTFGDAPFVLVNPSSNSDGAFSYTSSNTAVATISGNTVTIVGTGSTTITATQAETIAFTIGTITANLVSQVPTILTNFNVPNKTSNDSSFVLIDPSSNSNGAFTYTSSNPIIATISGNTVTILAAGTTTITATQGETTNYTSASIESDLKVKLILSLTICFPAKTPVETDQGLCFIENIDPTIHTIKKKAIICVTKTVTPEKHLVCIEKHALCENAPSKKTYMSRNHKLLYKDNMVTAKSLVDKVDGVYYSEYNGEPLYNIVLESYDTMTINNMTVETLHPENLAAKLFNSKYSENETNELILNINHCVKTHNWSKYESIRKSICK